MIEETKQTPFLTTVDNVWNPFTNYDEWLAFDMQKGYNSCCYLARMTPDLDEISTEIETLVINDAICEIVKENPGIFIAIVDSRRGNEDSEGAV